MLRRSASSFAVWAVLASLAAPAKTANAQPVSFRAGEAIIDLNRVHWAPLKAEGVPPGPQIFVLRGSLSGGPVEVLIKLPAHYTLPNHSHTSDETYVWLKGPFRYVNRDGRSAKFGAQTFIGLPGNTSHALICGSQPCIFYVRYSQSFDMKVYPMPKLK
jgi:quercetin dioxygenase-like cupin family protein